MAVSQSSSALRPKNRQSALLLVDDEPQLRAVLARQLTSAGFAVHGAGGGQEALAYLSEHPVDLIISDIRMPNGDGIELLRASKAAFPAIPILLMTGYANTPPEEVYHLGAEAILLKPFQHAHFLEVLTRSVMPLRKRWSELAAPPEKSELVLSFGESLGELGAAGIFHVGRGGFSVRVAALPVPGESLVNFEIEFAQGKPKRLTGQGVLKWNHSHARQSERQFVGIEIKSLIRDSFEPWLACIEAEQPHSYIPWPPALAKKA